MEHQWQPQFIRENMLKKISNDVLDFVCYKYKSQITDLIRETQRILKDVDFEVGRRYYKRKILKEKK